MIPHYVERIACISVGINLSFRNIESSGNRNLSQRCPKHRGFLAVYPSARFFPEVTRKRRRAALLYLATSAKNTTLHDFDLSLSQICDLLIIRLR